MKKQFPLFAGKSLLITGSNGFIGRHTARAAAHAGFSEVILLSRSSAVGTGGLQPASSGLPPEQGASFSGVTFDLLDRSSLNAFAHSRTFDFIINLAGKIDHSSGPDIFSRQFEINFQTTLNLVEAFQNRVGRFIQVGSGMEYGVAPVPHTPDGPVAPASAYGASKLAASQLVLAKARSEKFPGLVARPFSVYGDGQPEKSFLGTALAAARKGQGFPTTLGEQTRDFVPVEKVAAELIGLCALSDESLGQIFNLCTGVELSLRRVLEIIKELFPAFTPGFGAIPYRDTELMRSAGFPFRSWTKEETESALRCFLSAR
jgi:nucleoside-diphosphate-sugar epimerase